jgi:threonylcarbamoyladenosine tRNA methylthiotransferase MtaB
MRTVSLHTLGCKLNFAETSSIGRQFRERGYELVDKSTPSDVFVLNTCSVTERADRECRQLIRRIRKTSPHAYIVVAGCYAQLQPGALASIKGVDLILGTTEKFNIFKYTEALTKERVPRIHISPADGEHETVGASSADTDGRTRSFLKIQDGCDYSCTFCLIPLARGGSRSASVSDIMARAREAIELGHKEIVLTGVNVGHYGKSSDSTLLALLKELITLDQLERIRISSIEPNLLNDELLNFWLTDETICNHFHIPLQSGSDTLLKAMRRRYLTQHYADRLEKIREKSSNAGIGADVLVGFPGETDELFEETYEFLRGAPLSYLHVFTYSERPNTPASSFEGRVEPRVRAERSERLRLLGLRKRRMFHEQFVGTKEEVLFESRDHEGNYVGLTQQYVRVAAPSIDDLANQIREVTIVSADEIQCLGEILAVDEPLKCLKEPINA